MAKSKKNTDKTKYKSLKYTKKQLKKILPFLKKFDGLNKEQQDVLFPYLSDQAYECMTVCLCNVSRNSSLNSKIRSKLVSALSPKKKLILKLLKDNIPNDKKNTLFKNGIGGSMVGLVLSAAVPLIDKYINS